MTVGEARAIARQWVSEDGAQVPGFVGAYFAGSISWLADAEPLPPMSDLDVNLVVEGHCSTRRKIAYRGVLLEANYIAMDSLQTPEAALSDYHLAGGLSKPGIIADASGCLTSLQAAVSRHYAERRWVRRRCEQALRKVVQQLDAIDATGPLVDQVIGWVFATGVTTHVLLSAGLRNPTVRLRYLAARRLLADYGLLHEYERLIRLLGCGSMTAERVEAHIAALSRAFDAAATAIRSPFVFAADISDLGGHAAIDGSLELVAQGHHREAVFWLVVTYARVQQVLAADAPADAGRHEPGFRALIGDLGIDTSPDVRRRADEVRQALPWLRDLAETIMAANAGIREDASVDGAGQLD